MRQCRCGFVSGREGGQGRCCTLRLPAREHLGPLQEGEIAEADAGQWAVGAPALRARAALCHGLPHADAQRTGRPRAADEVLRVVLRREGRQVPEVLPWHVLPPHHRVLALRNLVLQVVAVPVDEAAQDEQPRHVQVVGHAVREAAQPGGAQRLAAPGGRVAGDEREVHLLLSLHHDVPAEAYPPHGLRLAVRVDLQLRHRGGRPVDDRPEREVARRFLRRGARVGGVSGRSHETGPSRSV
mmetsp:Transcript_13197/g.33202  ORF Transcript_13197/g.33202 Transcript_13197/m.33202 type:complete len:241 (-) Transcript_13197:107-829(-)